MYAVYHGPKGIKSIASHVHSLASTAANAIEKIGYEIGSHSFFDTIWIKNIDSETIKLKAELLGFNFYLQELTMSLPLASQNLIPYEEVEKIVNLFSELKSETSKRIRNYRHSSLQKDLLRSDEILSQDIFNSYHSESKMMRYLKKLENKDLVIGS